MSSLSEETKFNLSSSWVIYNATSGRKQHKLSVFLNMAFRLKKSGSALC